MRREPEVELVTSRRSSYLRRQSTRDEDMSSYSIHGHLANVCETNGNSSSSRADWLQRPRSSSMSRRGSIRLARMSSSRVDNDRPLLWRGHQSTPGADLEQDDGSRTNRLLSSILDELRQLTGKMERDEARQDEVNDCV